MSMSSLRSTMVESLAQRGVTDARVLDAFRKVPRELFVPEFLREQAYSDRALPIGAGQTISQPYIVALSVQALGLQPTDRVLEVGTGSGYCAAILSQLAAPIYTIERQPVLLEIAQRNLLRAGVDRVRLFLGDGSLGLPEAAPFDAIVVAASAPHIPASLLSQLRPGGRLVIPVGTDEHQHLSRVTRKDHVEFVEEKLCDVLFVPLVGKQAWPE